MAKRLTKKERKRANRPQVAARAAEIPFYKRPSNLILSFVLVAVLALVVFGTLQAVSTSNSSSDFDFEVYQGQELLGGTNISFNDVLALGKPVALNFWAGDCPPCRAEMPGFQRVHKARGDEVIILGMDVGVFTGLGNRNNAIQLLGELGITYPAGAPPSRKPVIDYAVRGLPVTVFLNADGTVFPRWDGPIQDHQFAQTIDELIAAHNAPVTEHEPVTLRQ
jgi:thiol-disulfide isomerase/thioredoxin